MWSYLMETYVLNASEVTTLWRNTNLFIILIYLHVQLATYSQWGKFCCFHYMLKSKKAFSFRGALPNHSLPPNQGLCPQTPLGTGGSAPRFMLSRLRARNRPLAWLSKPLIRPCSRGWGGWCGYGILSVLQQLSNA